MSKKLPDSTRDFVTHYFYDARLSPPSNIKGYAASEHGARRAAVERVGLEQYNKAVVEHRWTGVVELVLRRNPRTNAVDFDDTKYQRLMGGTRRREGPR